MLLQIREFISREKVVSTQQLSREFRLELTALQPMLDLWEKKGVIQKCKEVSCLSKCSRGCKLVSLQYYQLIN